MGHQIINVVDEVGVIHFGRNAVSQEALELSSIEQQRGAVRSRKVGAQVIFIMKLAGITLVSVFALLLIKIAI